MKARNGFISNSSSCSFIVSSDDNEGKLLLHNPTTLTLKELLDRFSEKLFCFDTYYCSAWPPDGCIIDIVSDCVFAKAFLEDKMTADPYSNGKTHILVPAKAEAAFKLFKLVAEDRRRIRDLQLQQEDEASILDMQSELANEAYHSLVDEFYKALYAHLGSMTFAWEEVEDNFIDLPELVLPSKKSIYADDLDEDEQADAQEHREHDIYYAAKGNDNEVDLVKSRIKRFKALGGKLEFLRIYSNH